MSQYFYSANGDEGGPFSLDELSALIQRGVVPQTGVARRAESEDWQVISSFPEFRSSLEAWRRSAKREAFKSPVLSSLYRILGGVAAVLALVMLPTGVQAAAWGFSALFLFGIAQLVDLIGKIEFNTRPK